MDIKRSLIPIAIILILAMSLNVSSAENPITINNTTTEGIVGAINDGADYDTIYLNPGIYSGENNSNIEINREITIIGNSDNRDDIVIDGSYLSRLFTITNNGALTLRNLTIINGFVNQIGDESGGAIYNEGNLTVENCVLANNSATNFDWENMSFSFGGAICNIGGTTIIKDSYFSDNIATGGGAIAVEGGILEIENSDFIDNSANYAGGAIANGETGTITVKNSRFRGNNAYLQGGVIALEGGELIIEESRFIHNEATEGGAIWMGEGNVSISDSFFHGNEAELFGGAIYHDLGDLTISGTTFDENIAIGTGSYYDGYGGAIMKVQGTLIIDDSIFTNNEALAGGSISVGSFDDILNDTNHTADVTITNSTFDNNNGDWGAGIFLWIGNATISDSIFNENKATMGSAITTMGVNLDIYNSNFTSNSAVIGGAMATEDAIIYINNSYFYNNSAIQDGGAICIEDGEMKVENSYFESNIAPNGGAINVYAGDYELINATFYHNEADNGGAFYIIDGFLTIDNSNFIHNEANNGGGIYVENDADIEITDSFFHGNEAISNGGAINHGLGDLVIECTTFDENIAIGNESYLYGYGDGYGGAIFKHQGTISIDNSIFTENYAATGGAITLGTFEDLLNETNIDVSAYISNSEFKNNSAQHFGGALFGWLGNMTVVNSSFNKNHGEGGAAISSMSINLEIYDSNFTDNHAGAGGAIATEDAIVYIENSNFNNNTGDELGGAIAIEGGEYTIVNSDFRLNSGVEGGAIWIIEGTLQINNTTFYHNEAEKGGAIYLSENGTLYIEESNFTHNEANNGGGIYIEEGTLEIQDSFLHGNEATVNGGAIYHDLGDLTIDNTIFDENSAIGNLSNPGFDGYGGGIYKGTGILEIANTNFTDNSAVVGGAIDIGGMMNIINGDTDIEVSISNSLFENNFAYFGGGFFSWFGDVEIISSNFTENTGEVGAGIGLFSGTVTVEDSIFINNNATSENPFVGESLGGAIAMEDGNLNVINSYFENNSANEGGAIGAGSGNVEIINSTFYENIASYDGGAIFLGEGELNVIGSEFENNTANEKGGAIYHEGSDISIKDSNFYNNPGENNIGGDLFNSGEIIIENSNFTINYAILGKDITLYYKNGTQYVIVLKHIDGRVIANAPINLILNGVKRTATTDENGEVSVNINYNPGIYEVSATYESPEGNLTVTNNIEVFSTIEGEDLVKHHLNDTQYQITVLDGKGNIVANQEVTFNINGIIYTKNTNSAGIVTLNINLNPGKYIVTVTNLKDGLQWSNNIVVLSTLNATDITKHYRNDTPYEVIVLDEEGNPSANRKVTFNINGEMYTKITNSAGIAKLNINLNPGKYIITATLDTGLSISNNIVVLETLKGSDLNKTFNESKAYEVKVLDRQGNPLEGETVEININGVMYYKASDSNGIAKLDINLIPDSYIATATWNGYSTSNIVNVFE
ncbi:hypothetical protein LJB96_01005 [Methanobrevibacter sp. OttesenSCG-928-K11]|nr:hypothetical protein [Methanobrevibacter sp. OttesenSCG-928-K11]MDL2270278.1 hypothetical protein [Methanobrevibacter sp. OttesenSCG-928-I08]